MDKLWLLKLSFQGGPFRLSPAHAPAGTKRLSNLLRCSCLSPDVIDDFLWQETKERQETLARKNKPVFLLWDEIVLKNLKASKRKDRVLIASSRRLV